MEELLKHHIRETERRFEELKDSIELLDAKVSELSAFKIETIFAARWASLLIGSVCGFLSMIATGLVSYLSNKH